MFRAYDIRGVYPDQINEEFAEKLGKAYGTYVGGKVAIGGDVRLSTPQLKRSLIKGILSTGTDVVDLGMVTTPMIYNTVVLQKLDGGISVTASHNPKEYNGFKMMGKNAVCFSWESGIKQIKEIFDSENFKSGQGVLEEKNVEDSYIKDLLSKAKVKGRKKVVLDAGNGACGLVGIKVFQKLGWEVIPLFCEPDGNFPNHPPHPVKRENLVHLQEKVKTTDADLGLAFDGDGDRVGVVDERGEVVDTSKVMALFIKDALTDNSGASVVYEVVISKIVEDTIKKFGGRPVLTCVGYPNIKKAFMESNAVIGGENSGHFYFKENYGYDDALYAALKIAEFLNHRPLNEQAKEIPEYITTKEYRPFCEDERKFQVIETLQTQMRNRGYDVNTIDGVRVILDKGWFIIRASNTNPKLSVRWEAEDNESFQRIGDIVKDALKLVNVGLKE